VTDGETAGSGGQPGPAREQIVIKDNRKVDASGRRNGGDPVQAADLAQATEATETVQAEATMGEAEPKVDETAAEIVDAEIISDDVVTEELAQGRAGNDRAGNEKAGKPGPEKKPEPATGLGAELEALRSELDERLRDLQRVTAEYANYRRRVERDRGAVVEQATGLVISALLPILDDLDRAREHDDLVGPSAAMAEQLNASLAKFGLTGFGEVGDGFDPTRHEAVAHQTSADVTEPTCVAVMRRGYLLGDRLLRPALVAVADPE
jgi:molecular chaperone GrpE